MGDFEATGDLVSGALLGRAMDRHGGGDARDGGHGRICLNCGTALIGPHCHQCGQDGHVHRSLGAIGHEILHGVAHFEGKLWRTLPMLLWRPGELTRRFIAGERVRFVSPMAIFLFSIFTMFAVFQIAGISPPADMKSMNAYPRAAIEQQREALEKTRREQIERRDALPAGDPDRGRRDARIAEADRDIAGLNAAMKQLGVEREEKREVHTGWHLLDHGIEKWDKNPSLMIYKLQASSYKFSWLLIPLSVPFVWLLFFWKRRYHLYDHTVFVTYSIAFMSLLFIAITIGAELGLSRSLLTKVALVVPFVHVTRQLQQAYTLRWRWAILRAVVLTGFIGIVLTLFVAILLVMGTLG